MERVEGDGDEEMDEEQILEQAKLLSMNQPG